jgi:hypothetical protein
MVVPLVELTFPTLLVGVVETKPEVGAVQTWTGEPLKGFAKYVHDIVAVPVPLVTHAIKNEELAVRCSLGHTHYKSRRLRSTAR